MAWTRLIKGELNRALKYAERSLVLAKESSKKYYIASSFKFLGQIFHAKGDLDRGIRNYEQSLVLFKELNNKDRLAWVLNNVSSAYRMGGEYERALECIGQSMALHRELGKLRMLADNYDYLIQILIDKSDLERAQISLHEMEQIKNQLKDEDINLTYLYDKALVLKTSLRARDRGKAEEIYSQFLEDENLDFESKYTVLLNLCELLLTELRITNDQGVLDELTQFIGQLLEIAEKSHSYWILCETYLLQAKLSLLTFNIKKSQRFLTQAHQIAERFDLNQLMVKIADEEEDLDKKLDLWERLKEEDAPMSERMELARLDEKVVKLIQKRTIFTAQVSEEKITVSKEKKIC
ncbi:MAG: tetratricopeptide repeat protein, partial [Candidatus Lokiarchaeota archaeon]|nr:tetratricopeptide repeat protein [Candidatus Lokiarchaeota archaeon]